MRQLVSVVTDDAVAYFVHDGDEARQIARLVNPGLDVDEVVELGVSLAEVLRVNGRRAVSRRSEPEPVAELEPPAEPDPPRRRMRRWGAGWERVLDDLRRHPGSTYADIARRVTRTREPGAIASVSATIGDIRKRGYTIRSESFNAGGVSKVRLTLEEAKGDALADALTGQAIRPSSSSRRRPTSSKSSNTRSARRDSRDVIPALIRATIGDSS